MKQKDKDLLLLDLCSRLPYEVKIQYEDNIFTIDYISAMYEEIKLNTHNKYTIDVLEVKPYLFPLSSMTDTQIEEYESLCIKETSECIDISGFYYTKDNYYDTVESIDYLYKNHIDIRGLIPKGLAIDCTGLNIYV